MLFLQVQHYISRNGRPKCKGKMALYGNECIELDTEESCTRLYCYFVKNRIEYRIWKGLACTIKLKLEFKA